MQNVRQAREIFVAALLASLVPAYLMLTAPPFFNFIDTCVMFQSVFSFNFPHWKGLQLVFLRVMNSLFSGVGLDRFFDMLPVNSSAMLAIVTVQHLCTMAAVLFFSWTVARTTWGRLLCVALLSVFPITFLSSHFIALEGFLSALLLTLVGMVVRVSRFDGLSRRNLALLALVSFAVCNVRHDFAVLLALAPLAVLAADLLAKAGLHAAARRFALVLVVSVAVLLATMAVEKVVLRVIGAEVDSIAGRMYSVRIDVADAPRMSSEEIEQLRAAMTECMLDVPGAAMFVQMLMYPQGDTYSNVQNLLAQQNAYFELLTQRQRNDRTDMVLNRLTWCCVRANPARWLIQGWERFKPFKDIPLDQSSFVGNSKGFIQVSERYPVTVDLVDGAFLSQDGHEYDAIAASPLYAPFHKVTMAWLAAAVFIAVLLGLLAAPRRVAQVPALGPLLLVGAVHLVLVGFLAAAVPRYGFAFSLLYYAALLLLGVGILESKDGNPPAA